MRKVVVIDDSAVTLEAVKLGLEAAGFAVVGLQSPIGSGIIISLEKPDAVLVDMAMASMSGESVVKGLKKRRDCPRVLLFSERSERELAEAAVRCGADAWIRKSAD